MSKYNESEYAYVNFMNVQYFDFVDIYENMSSMDRRLCMMLLTVE